MKLYNVKAEVSSDKAVVLDDMILTKDMPTTAGSKMLENFVSLFEAEVVTRIKNAGYEIAGKAGVGEFAIDLLGETSAFGAVEENGVIKNPAAEIVKSGDALAAVCLDVNGSVRRGAAQSGLVSIKPTYGTVSRYGTIPVACSGETVSVIAKDTKNCRELLSVMAGHDDKDGTSHPENVCESVKKSEKKVTKVAVITSLLNEAKDDVKTKTEAFVSTLKNNGIEVAEVEESVLKAARVAWNILMSAELCNNVSRYDGVKYGYRTNNFTNLDELYTNSRTEAFGELLKTTILFGSETLSTENYMKQYDKAMRVRRVISETFDKLFSEYDAVIMPACSEYEYKDVSKYGAFYENLYTAPASVTGLPAVVCNGVQIVGKAFSDSMLLDIAEIAEKEGK